MTEQTSTLDLSHITPLKSENVAEPVYRAKPFPYSQAQLAWLTDLETTEEPQAEGYLCKVGKDGGFCCLGRAAVILGIQGIFSPEKGVIRFDGHDGSLSADLTKRIGLRSGTGDFERSMTLKDKFQDSLAACNDAHGTARLTFKEIAAYIRHDPWNVFVDPGKQEPVSQIIPDVSPEAAALSEAA